ncbi:MAG: hypothetical protein LUC41_04760 [Clostridiales bacterium]|nr:hypothetical protein [Clostridiales bacterium]
MDVQILTMDLAKKLAETPFSKRTAWINVCSDYTWPLELDNQPQYYLEIDLSEFIFSCDDDERLWRGFDMEQAERIADFLEQHRDEIDVLVCQGDLWHDPETQLCSVSIAAAFKQYTEHTGIDIFKVHIPDISVFQMVYEALTHTESLATVELPGIIRD